MSSMLSSCKKTRRRVYEPVITIQEDVTVPFANTNKTIIKKGDKYNILKRNNLIFNKYLYFMNVNDKKQIAQNTEDFINNRIDDISKELTSVDLGVETYKTENKLTN